MALIVIASDKGAPGVTTAALALAAVWPRPVLLAECDPAGGDLVYRFPAAGGGNLDPRRGVLSLAVVARRGMQPQQVWEHAQKLHGGLDVLAGVTNAEQGAGLSLLWGPIGKVLASLPQADVIADCGRLGADGPLYDLLAEATTVVLVTKVHVAAVIRLRDRAAAFAAAVQSRGRRGFEVGVVVVADHKKFRASISEVQHVLGQGGVPATVVGGIAHDTKGADLLGGEWGGNLDRTMLIKTAREVAKQLAQGLPPIGHPPVGHPVAGPPAWSGPATPPVPASAGSPPPPAEDLVAATHPAPTVSAAAPRTTFGRVLGPRTGRHQADPAQAAGGGVRAQAQTAVSAGLGAPAGAQAGGPTQPRAAARHAQGAARPVAGPGSAFSRAPMSPMPPPAPAASASSASQVPASLDPVNPRNPENPENPEYPENPENPEYPENPENPEYPENPDDSGWDTAPWQHAPRSMGSKDPMGSMGSMGSSRPGGG